MALRTRDEAQLDQKHEEILEQRAALLQQMERCFKRQQAQRKLQAAASLTAQERNRTMLQDCQRLQERLRTRTLLRPDVLSLQTQYWASVEQKMPEWESYLLGKGPAPMSTASQQSTKPTSPGQNGSRSSQSKARSPI